jgi:hypothetical protein
MESLMQRDDENNSSKFSQQALSFIVHIALALGSWLALMFVGYVLNPPAIPQLAILALSFLVPFGVGNVVTRYRQDEMAPLVWLIGLIWVLIISLWILDMPTGPNQCFQCDATEKLTRTFFSLPKPSGLIDNDGPFLCTWPAAAFLGYAIGAGLALKKRTEAND